MQVLENKLSVRHCLTFVTGLVECLCFAGAVFGWASLVFVLKEDGYFSSLCFNTTGFNGTQILDCSAQDEQLSLIFTIATFMNNFLTLPNGFIFDHFGTAVSRLLAIFLYTTGSLMVALSSPVLPFLLFPALPLLAVGGIIFLITNMQVGNLFGSRRSTIINLYNGAFDSSSALFLIIKLLHESGVSLRAAFLFLSSCSVVLILRTFFLLPRTFIPHPLPDRYTYGVSCGALETMNGEVTANGCAHTGAKDTLFTNDVPLKQEKTFRECLLSRFFVGHLLWLSVMQFRHFLFIGTLNPMLLRLTEGDTSLAVRCAVRSLEWPHHGQTQGKTSSCRGDGAGGRPAGVCAFFIPDGAAVRLVLSVCLHPLPAASVPHLHPAGAEPLLPLWWHRSLHQRGVSIVSLREAVWSWYVAGCVVLSAAVSLLRSGERSSGWRSFIHEHQPDAAQLAGLHASPLCLPPLSKTCLSERQ